MRMFAIIPETYTYDGALFIAYYNYCCLCRNDNTLVWTIKDISASKDKILERYPHTPILRSRVYSQGMFISYHYGDLDDWKNS